MSFDPGAVRAFEHAGWQKAAAHYAATSVAALRRAGSHRRDGWYCLPIATLIGRGRRAATN